MRLLIPGPIFFSLIDEKMFFEWMLSLDAIADVQGEGTSLEINIADNHVNDSFVYEILAIFRRYNIPLLHLRVFHSEDRHWLSDPKMAWHEEMFTKDTDRK